MEIIYENEQIKDFEIKIFASGNCKCFIPMSFVKIKDKLLVKYHTEGFHQLDLCNINNPYEILDILEKLILNIKRAQNHLILQSRYTLLNNHIYLEENTNDIKIKFVPIKESLEYNLFSQKIILFLKQIHISDIRSLEYVDMVVDKLEKYNLSMESLINYLGELKREAYLCGWG